MLWHIVPTVCVEEFSREYVVESRSAPSIFDVVAVVSIIDLAYVSLAGAATSITFMARNV